MPGGGSPTVDVSLRFPGQLEDAETGMHYNWWRFYSPENGRYFSSDPAGIRRPNAVVFGRYIQESSLSMNGYDYAASSTFRFADPTGLEVVQDPDNPKCVLQRSRIQDEDKVECRIDLCVEAKDSRGIPPGMKFKLGWCDGDVTVCQWCQPEYNPSCGF